MGHCHKHSNPTQKVICPLPSEKIQTQFPIWCRHWPKAMGGARLWSRYLEARLMGVYILRAASALVRFAFQRGNFVSSVESGLEAGWEAGRWGDFCRNPGGVVTTWRWWLWHTERKRQVERQLESVWGRIWKQFLFWAVWWRVGHGLWDARPVDEDKCLGLGSGIRKGEIKAQGGRERMLQQYEQKNQEE